MNEPWCVRNPDEVFNPEEAYVNYPENFLIEIHHGGEFTQYPGMTYAKGKVSYVDKVNSYYFSVIVLKDMMVDIGYRDEDGMRFMYRLPGEDLDLGLRPLLNDGYILDLLKLSRTNKLIDVFVEHIRPDYEGLQLRNNAEHTGMKHGGGEPIPEMWVDQGYWYETWKLVYECTIEPINGMDEWPKSRCPTTLLPPKHHNQIGRPKKKRNKLAEELTQTQTETQNTEISIPDTGKLTRKGNTVTCEICKARGHNKRTCKKRQKKQDVDASQDGAGQVGASQSGASPSENILQPNYFWVSKPFLLISNLFSKFVKHVLTCLTRHF
ncbi:putative transcription factor interactor and regulator CCHC(Zn) family [Helianthus annuus]|nr:putative transcription factor interactor and regulator CCHC(Zn) family [Helianthus annuus]